MVREQGVGVMPLKIKERQYMKMQRLGTVQINSSVFVAFYNENMKAIDFFYKNEKKNDVECWTLTLNTVKRVFRKAIRNEKDFKKHFRPVFALLFSKETALEENFNLQVFPMQMWYDCVERDFKGYELQPMKATEIESEE